MQILPRSFNKKLIPIEKESNLHRNGAIYIVENRGRMEGREDRKDSCEKGRIFGEARVSVVAAVSFEPARGKATKSHD